MKKPGRKKKVWYGMICGLLLAVASLQGAGVWADEIVLKTGDAVDCIITGEEGDAVIVDIPGGQAHFHAGEIAVMNRASAKENNALRAAWTVRQQEQDDRVAKRREEAAEKLKRMTFVPADSKSTAVEGEEYVVPDPVPPPRLDVRKPKEERGHWGEIEKCNWKKWGSQGEE